MEKHFCKRSLSLLHLSIRVTSRGGQRNISVQVAAVAELSAMRSLNWRCAI
jgi:hypothetical protein